VLATAARAPACRDSPSSTFHEIVGFRATHQNSGEPDGLGRDSRGLRLGPTVALARNVGRRGFLLLLGFALGLGTGCNSALTAPDGGAKSCSGDMDCGAGQYCLGFSQVCATAASSYTAGAGTCHRDCSAGACFCSERADCGPGADCDAGRCVALTFNCPEEPSSCPTGCTLEPASDRVCGPVCRCEVCPAADGGAQCGWPTSLNDAGPGGCRVSRALVSCNGPSGGCACASDDSTTCPTPTTCDVAHGYTSCQDQCTDGEYAVACGGLPQPDASFVYQQPPSGCRLGLATPGGVAFYCCPCE